MKSDIFLHIIIIIIFCTTIVIRLISLAISIRNEKKLKDAGAVEYGKINSLVLTIFHIFFYLGSLVECIIRKTQFDTITVFGLGIYSFSIIMLFIVIKSLDGIWTTKLIIAKDHKINKNWLFKIIRHPNYFLNIIPELLSVAIICKAWFVLFIGFPLYLISLIVRIVQEEKIMRKEFASY